MLRYTYTVFAQAYGEGSYNECDYNCQTTAGAGTSSGGSAPTNPLADTGIVVVGIITLACLLIFIALLVRVMGKRSRKSTPLVASRQPGATAGISTVDR